MLKDELVSTPVGDYNFIFEATEIQMIGQNGAPTNSIAINYSRLYFHLGKTGDDYIFGTSAIADVVANGFVLQAEIEDAKCDIIDDTFIALNPISGHSYSVNLNQWQFALILDDNIWKIYSKEN